MTEDALPCLSRELADKAIENGFEQYKWYERKTLSAETRLSAAVWLGIALGISVSAIAALPGDLVGNGSQPAISLMKWIVVVGSLLATLFSATLAPRYRKLAADREKGRIATARLINTTRLGLMYQPMTQSERGQYLTAYEEALLQVDQDYGAYDGRTADSKNIGTA